MSSRLSPASCGAGDAGPADAAHASVSTAARRVPFAVSVPTTRSSARRSSARSGELAVDRLPAVGASLEVVLLHDASFGADTDDGPRRPHRHDYHELIWTRCGTGRHLHRRRAGRRSSRGTVTLIGRGQVHVFERAARAARRGRALRRRAAARRRAARASPAGCWAAAAGARSRCRPATSRGWRA